MDGLEKIHLPDILVTKLGGKQFWEVTTPLVQLKWA